MIAARVLNLHSRRIATLAATVLAALALLAAPGASTAAAAAPCRGADAKPGTASTYRLGYATACLVNRVRRQHGVRSLRVNSRLSQAAQRHAVDMVRFSYFSHDSRSGASFLTRIKRTGYLRGARSWAAGENIAWGSGQRGTPRSIVTAWMNSAGHRHNILSGKFREIGMGTAGGGPGWRGGSAATYVHDFGRR